MAEELILQLIIDQDLMARQIPSSDGPYSRLLNVRELVVQLPAHAIHFFSRVTPRPGGRSWIASCAL